MLIGFSKLRSLLAESGLSNLSFAAILMSAIHPKADVKLVLGLTSANDPKRKSIFVGLKINSVKLTDKLFG